MGAVQSIEPLTFLFVDDGLIPNDPTLPMLPATPLPESDPVYGKSGPAIRLRHA